MLNIRQEETKDHQAVFSLITSAFHNIEESDHKEQLLVERLRQSEAFIPELSLVAEAENTIIGYILLTKVEIISDTYSCVSLGLAPLAVHPSFQKKGVGSLLIQEAHRRAIQMGYTSVVVLGHKDYYSRFGYRKALDFGIHFPFDVPEEYCMVIELIPNGLKEVHGTVKYAEPFTE